MNNYLLKITFLGTEYHGWQKQKNALTVSEALETAVKNALGVSVSLKGCGRTDAGVHAINYYCSFTADINIAPESLRLALNSVLPKDIAVKKAFTVPKDFHARFSATEKEYIYKIYPSKTHNPFYENRVLNYKYPIDINKLNEAAALFVGTHDFSSFSATGSSVKDKVRTIYLSEFTQKGDIIEYRVRGNGFLYNMVRILVGTALKYNEGKITLSDIESLFNGYNRSLAGKTVSGAGLYLNDVWYGEEIF
ncbi:MAG: tRNA pseudouridine(38-40) synthase TruA [Clostridia bacterium]|nr:tRNA pseudouridine(38-40) synthase TruA [Clostridia bacterium]